MNKKSLLKYIVLFLTGYCMYIALEVSFRGYSYVLMGIVAGICFFVIDKINDNLSWDIPIVFQMFIGTAIILMLELISGTFALRVLDVRMWDYSNLYGSCFNGLICPQFAAIWYFLSGLVIIISDVINYYILHSSVRPYYRIWRFDGRKHYLPERSCK